MKAKKIKKKLTFIVVVLLLSFWIPFANSCSTEGTVLTEQNAGLLDDNESLTYEETTSSSELSAISCN